MPRKITKTQFRNKKILHRDKEVYKSFFKVGILRKEDVLKIGMSNSKFSQLEKFKYVEKKLVEDRLTKEVVEVYKLTRSGVDFIKDKMSYHKPYYGSNSLEHDLGVLKLYMSVREQDPNFSADMWRNEHELRDMFKEYLDSLKEQNHSRYDEIYDRWQKGLISTPDFAVVNEGQAHYVEITTSAYTEEMKEAKADFANEFSSQITFCRAY